ncbi:MAG TPA: tetratricopeptide repeat protein, partial [Candidatus Binatia bacterium]|nr:tetratricopeptide repeat protein [Candidatus Binatia bacterium]
MDLGSMYGQRYDYIAAENCFERALRISGQNAEVLSAAGKISLDFGNFTLAERYLRRAVGQNNVSPEIMIKLAEVSERLRRTED